jgi:hypothetical protein
MFSLQSILLYLLVGAGVAVALYVTDRHSRAGERLFIVTTALVLWPIFLPILLARQPAPLSAAPEPRRAKDEMDKAIDRVDADLSKALASLEGWAGGALAGEAQRIHELRHAWSALADRIREMDRLLCSTESTAEPDVTSCVGPDVLSSAVQERLQRSVEVRRQNLERLRGVRRRAYEDLMGTLAWVRELVSMIHLAKFTGAPAARAQELVAQIAAAVEGLSEVSWEETPLDNSGQQPEARPAHLT